VAVAEKFYAIKHLETFSCPHLVDQAQPKSVGPWSGKTTRAASIKLVSIRFAVTKTRVGVHCDLVFRPAVEVKRHKQARNNYREVWLPAFHFISIQAGSRVTQ
jgi:hypothetical protein